MTRNEQCHNRVNEMSTATPPNNSIRAVVFDFGGVLGQRVRAVECRQAFAEVLLRVVAAMRLVIRSQ